MAFSCCRRRGFEARFGTMNRLSLSILGSLALVFTLTLKGAEKPTHSAVTPAPREGGWMKRHEQFNQNVQAHQGDIDLIFVGDSITQGWEGAGKAVWETYYGHRKALNLGIGGDRTQHVLWRLDHGNLEGISPKVAVVMIGTNNSGDDRNTADEMVDGITAVVNKLKTKLPETKILLLGIFPRGENFNDQRGKILQVNQAIQKLQDWKRVQYLDIGHRFMERSGSIPKAIMPDFLHFSTAGYGIWASAMEKRISTLLKDRPVEMTHADFSGEWTFSIQGPNGEMVDSPLNIKQNGARIRGIMSMGPDRSFDLEHGGIFGDQIDFTITRDRPQGGQMIYQLKGTLKDQRLEGKVTAKMDGETTTIDWSAKR